MAESDCNAARGSKKKKTGQLTFEYSAWHHQLRVGSSGRAKNSSFELHSQSMEERATLDRYHHFHGHSGMCAWLAS
jgi:hypothetical protein